jgi:hypothetical protein
MSAKAVSWALSAAVAVGGVLLLNYWASYQPLSTLVYSGIVAALLGLANLVVHATRVHARPEQLIRAVRESTFSDMKSLGTLLRIRAAVVRDPGRKRGVTYGAVNVREQRRPDVRTAQEFVAYHEPGGVKMAFDLRAEDEGFPSSAKQRW